MIYTKDDIKDFMEENNVKFVRLAFCDIYGKQKNISVMPSEFEQVLDHGFAFDPATIEGFESAQQGALYLFPDPRTATLLPWRPSQGRVARFFCDVRNADGSPFVADTRHILTKAMEDAKKAGIRCLVGSECEFYLFKTDENGNPTSEPFDNAGFMDISPADRGENVRREICLTLEEMGITPLSSHHEEGPGQNEIDFRTSHPLCAADDVITFRMVVKNMASRNGVFATFAPKPIEGKCGNGYHISISPMKNRPDEKISKSEFDSFMAGIMLHIKEMSAFLNPVAESYKRLGENMAPKYITWAEENRTGLIRTVGSEKIELRSPDSRANPYIALSLLIYAGLDGMEKKLTPPAEFNRNMYTIKEDETKDLDSLPSSLAEAIEIAKNSEFIKAHLPQIIIDDYIKKAE